MGPEIMALPVLYSMPGRIIDGCPVEPTGLALERGMLQSPDPPMGDLCGTMPLFMGPGNETGMHLLLSCDQCSLAPQHLPCLESMSLKCIDSRFQQ